MKNRVAMKSDVLRIMHAKRSKSIRLVESTKREKNMLHAFIRLLFVQTDRQKLFDQKFEKKKKKYEKRIKINRALKYVTIFIINVAWMVFRLDWYVAALVVLYIFLGCFPCVGNLKKRKTAAKRNDLRIIEKVNSRERDGHNERIELTTQNLHGSNLGVGVSFYQLWWFIPSSLFLFNAFDARLTLQASPDKFILFFLWLFLVEHEKIVFSFLVTFENCCRSCCYFDSVFFFFLFFLMIIHSFSHISLSCHLRCSVGCVYDFMQCTIFSDLNK